MAVTRKEFTRFVASTIGPWLKSVGYKKYGGLSFRREVSGVVRSVEMVLDSPRSRFIPRLYILLEPFSGSGEIGVTLTRDVTQGDDGFSWWRCPKNSSSHDEISERVVQSLEQVAVPWLDLHGDLERLIDQLERERLQVGPGPDVGALESLLRTHGLKTQTHAHDESDGVVRPNVRPDLTEHLSYCYQLQSRWKDALRVWREYCQLFPGGEGSKIRQANEARLAFLQTQAGS